MRSLLPRTSLLYLNLFDENSAIAENFYFFEPDKYLQYPTGDIELEIIPSEKNTWHVTLNAKTVMRDLQLIPPRHGRLSDNFITLLPGRQGEVDVQFEDNAPAVCTPVQILSACQLQIPG